MPGDSVLQLVGEIKESLVAIEGIHGFYSEYRSSFDNPRQRDQRDAIVLSEILCNYYTCLETVFLRISQHFENNLAADRWHKALLQSMRIEVPGVRKALVSRDTFELLDELRRFRHFKRYYYELHYDWTRLDYLKGVYDRVHPAMGRHLKKYMRFLERLAQSP